jgi:hypothetical protein
MPREAGVTNATRRTLFDCVGLPKGGAEAATRFGAGASAAGVAKRVALWLASAFS